MTPRNHAEKLISSLPKATRRAQFSASTRRALVEAATELFTTKGYAGTSLDAIVADARVTKGALYHHFSGKQAIFEAVFEHMEGHATETVKRAIKPTKDPWVKAQAGLAAFLDVVRQPAYQRVVIQDGPAVLGYERFREQDERSSYAVVEEIARTVLRVSSWELDEPMLETFSRIFFGALSAAGASIGTAEDPDAAAARVQAAIGFILTGLQALADSGVELPDPVGQPDDEDDDTEVLASPESDDSDGRADSEDDAPE